MYYFYEQYKRYTLKYVWWWLYNNMISGSLRTVQLGFLGHD